VASPAVGPASPPLLKQGLRSLYLNELKEACDCEAQIIDGLPMMAASAGSIGLRSIIRHHVAQTMQHGRQVEAILRRHGTSPKPGYDQVAAALVRKAGEIMWELSDPDLRDAALIAMGRRVVHHQIAAYSAAESYAEVPYLEIDRRSLLAILQEEKSTDSRLASLQSEVNQMVFLVNPKSC